MNIDFDKIFDLFEMVNFGDSFSSEGYLCKESGKTYFHSDFSEEEPLPDDIDEDRYLMIPSKSELGLGNKLAFEFTESYLPSKYDDVRSYFRSKGAYLKFKRLLEEEGMLESWFKFEQDRTVKALRHWCLVNELQISG